MTLTLSTHFYNVKTVELKIKEAFSRKSRQNAQKC